MLTIRGNQGSQTGISTVVLTLYEKCKRDNPYFTWKLVNKASGEEIIMAPEDISESPTIFNKFVIEVSGDNPIPTLGKIQAEPGEYQYFIYEASEPEQMDLDECTNLVESGILIIKINTPSVPVWNNYDTIKIYKY